MDPLQRERLEAVAMVIGLVTVLVVAVGAICWAAW